MTMVILFLITVQQESHDDQSYKKNYKSAGSTPAISPRNQGVDAHSTTASELANWYLHFCI